MFETQFCKIEYLVTINAVQCLWKQFCEGDDYREPLKVGLKLIHEHQAKVWITDTTNGFESNPEDTQWVVENFVPQTIDSSCKVIAFLMKENSPIKDEIETLAKALSEFFEVYICEDLYSLERLLK
jgi:hypothetical protein